MLGSRRPLLFVEGDETSYDSAIYTALYPKEMVVPRQSCEKVVEATKSMSGLSALHNLSVRGLVDRDRRGDEEVNALRADGVLVADVAEVENLLCLPEALEAVAKQLKAADVAKAKTVAEAVVIAEMAKVIDQQALARALAEIQFRLNNCKGVISFVAASFGTKKDVYCRMVLHFIKTEPEGPIAKAMRKAIDGKPDPVVVAPPVIDADSPEGATTAGASWVAK